ncbi:MAG: tetratricopeptide repeat protein [Nitrospiraceae bacterium]|nr:tetratricopeptide repeat protein [Nitrospiraceae bacterium]
MRFPHLQRVKKLVDKGDFDEAIRATQELLDREPAPPVGDGALFDLGLLYAHGGNAKKDYRKSRSLFNRLVRDYPKSPLAEEARVWAGVLEAFEKTKQVDLELEEMMKKGTGK